MQPLCHTGSSGDSKGLSLSSPLPEDSREAGRAQTQARISQSSQHSLVTEECLECRAPKKLLILLAPSNSFHCKCLSASYFPTFTLWRVQAQQCPCLGQLHLESPGFGSLRGFTGRNLCYPLWECLVALIQDSNPLTPAARALR